jgi:transcriptional regulator with XRE-family HTH domain
VDTLGRRLRALRAGAGRTVASVAAEAGLSVPYIANLENGRGNPTVAALERLARALGTELTLDLAPTGSRAAPAPSGPPAALVRLARTSRFRQLTAELAGPDGDPARVAGALVGLLAQVGPALRREPTEADWWRVLDALTLVALHPRAVPPGPPE